MEYLKYEWNAVTMIPEIFSGIFLFCPGVALRCPDRHTIPGCFTGERKCREMPKEDYMRRALKLARQGGGIYESQSHGGLRGGEGRQDHQ